MDHDLSRAIVDPPDRDLVGRGGDDLARHRVASVVVGNHLHACADAQAVGIAGVVAGSAFLTNVFGLGQVGSIFAAGTIPALNVVVGLEVVGGITLVLYEFLEQTLAIRDR